MKTYYPISHESAVQFWRNATSKKYLSNFTLQSRKLVALPIEYSCPDVQEIANQIHTKLGIEFPIVMVVPNVNAFKKKPTVKTVVRPKALPNGSFISLADKILIASPEYCFLTFSRSLPFEKLVEFSNNLCSMYLIDKSAEHGQSSFLPICTVKSISKYLSQVENFKGIIVARKAIKYSVDNSNSPMESKLAVILIIPRSRGGYGLPKMKMNYHAELSKRASKLIGRDSIMVDMCWPEEKVVVEYDSDETHLNSKQHEFDKARINALTQSGYTVITITKKDLYSINKLDTIVDTIRKALNLRNESKMLTKYFDKRKSVIMNLFYQKNTYNAYL